MSLSKTDLNMTSVFLKFPDIEFLGIYILLTQKHLIHKTEGLNTSKNESNTLKYTPMTFAMNSVYERGVILFTYKKSSNIMLAVRCKRNRSLLGAAMCVLKMITTYNL